MKAVLLAGALAAAPIVGVASPATPAAAATPQVRAVIIAVPDLRWADVEAMPRLRAWAAHASAAELSTKAASGTTRCADGSLTFAAGDRANADPEIEPCDVTPAEFVTTRAANLRSKFGADPGAFGQALADAHVARAAVGPDARALLADDHGQVPQVPDLPAALGSAQVVAVLDDELYDVTPDNRSASAASLDTLLADQLAQIPSSATVLVAGTSDGATTGMHLHALFIRGPGWRHVALRSPSTRVPYVQLRDLAPTVLSLLHVPVPSVMVGRPAYQTSAAVKTPAHYADDDDHAVTARDVGQDVRAVFAYVAVAVLLLLALARRKRLADPAALLLGTIAVAAPAFSFLVQLLPWWRWNSWIYALLVLAGGVVVGLACWLARRRSTAFALVIGPAFTAVVLVLDQLTGAHLQLSAPLGDNPIVAGRFHGMGNTDFALMCTSVVLCAGVAAGALRRAGHKRAAIAIASALCVIAIVVDAAPTIGDDFGGLLAMGPTAVLLVALLAGMRLTWWRALAAVVVAFAVAVGVAFLDYARPADQQTHVGRFVGQVLHGGAGDTLNRKFDASIASFKNAALSILVGVAIIVAITARRQVAETLRRIDGLTEAAIALVVLAVLGTFLNDSGVVVGGTVVLLAVFAAAASGLTRTGNDGAGGSPP